MMKAQAHAEDFHTFEQPLRLIALTAPQVVSIRSTLAYYVVLFKAYGLLIGCLAFGWFVYGFANGLLRWSALESVLLGLLAAPLLLMIEAYNLATTMGVPGLHLRRWLARLVVVTFVFGGVLGSAADRLKDDVDAMVATNVHARVDDLKASPAFSAALQAAQGDLQRANDREDHLARQQDNLLKLQSSHATALAERQMECNGATSKDGWIRQRGCGSKADGWEAEAARTSREIAAITAQIAAIGDPLEAKALARDRLGALQQEIRTQAEREHAGAGTRLAALFQAAQQDWGVLFVLAFMLGIYMLPDFIAWLALGHAPGGQNGPEGTYARLKEIDREVTDQALNALSHRVRYAGQSQLPLLEVKLASANPRPAAVNGNGETKAHGANDERVAAAGAASSRPTQAAAIPHDRPRRSPRPDFRAAPNDFGSERDDQIGAKEAA